MISIECPREQDALEAACAGTWPDRCDDDLRAHPQFGACGCGGWRFSSRVLGHIRRLTIEDGSVVVTATRGD